MAISPTRYGLRQRGPTPARHLPDPIPEAFAKRVEGFRAAVEEPFKGITADGRLETGLFSIRATGVSTEPIKEAAEAFLGTLNERHRAAVSFEVESDAWRRWSNIHPYVMRHGLCLDDLAEVQRERALALLGATLSAPGFQTARDVMRLNYTIGEITGKMGDEYGEWLYWISIFGTPSADEPWGWQFDGHHLIVNCLVLGDQVVMTPMFMGSEPVEAEGGKYAGTRVFADEEAAGLAFMRSLSPEQRARATVGTELPIELFTAAFRDNFEQRYEGIRFDELSEEQRRSLVEMIELYVGRMRSGHAEIRMEEVREHLAATHFAWIGECEEDSVFYYRIHGPVILIEFDHQRGIAFENDVPTRGHIHTVVRTPNGNDYGKDLLRQHYERHPHPH